MRHVFKDATLQTRYEQDGYVRVSAFEPQEIEKLIERYRSLPPIDDAGFFSAMFLDDSYLEYKREIDRALAHAGDALIARYLIEYRRLSGAFVTKKPGKDSTVPLHQDWTFVNEREHASISLWFPLCDTTHENGALYFLKGGHRLGFTLRGPGIPSALRRSAHLLEYEKLDYQPLRAGEAILFDHRVAHRSPPNLSTTPRVAAGLLAIPCEAQLLHYRGNASRKTVEKYGPPDDFVATYSMSRNRPPDGAEFLGEADGDVGEFSPDDVMALLSVRDKP